MQKPKVNEITEKDKGKDSRLDLLEEKINSITNLLTDLSVSSADSFLEKGLNKSDPK